MSRSEGRSTSRRQGRIVLLAALAPVVVGLMAFSQTFAWYGDEGMHLLAGQLVNAGKRPYLDFFYQHPPLYAYVTAGWLRVFGDSWRSAHVMSALLSGGCVLLIADFMYSCLRDPGWRLAGGIAAGALVGLQWLFIRFGTIGQPYALCALLTVVAFRLVIETPERTRGLAPMWAGLCAGAAGACSLLVAPVAPVMLLWIARHNRAGRGFVKCGQFVCGAVIPVLPLIWLAVEGPRQVWFDIVEYHAFHRSTWGLQGSAALFYNFGVWQGWLNSPQALLLAMLVAVGMLFLGNRKEWDQERLAQFRLCIWLLIVLGVYPIVAQPTYPQYFVFVVPFASILASVGVYALGAKVWPTGRPGWLVLATVGLCVVGLAKSAYHDRQCLRNVWRDIDAIASEVNRVTVAGDVLHANEAVYFAARRLPPPGLENSFAPELRLSRDVSTLVKVVPQSEIDRWLANGRFATVAIESDDPRVLSLGLQRKYAGVSRLPCYLSRTPCHMGSCYIFWGPAPHAEGPDIEASSLNGSGLGQPRASVAQPAERFVAYRHSPPQIR